MKLIVEMDEKPVFNLIQAYEWSTEVIDFPEEIYTEYLTAQYNYNKMQKILEEYYVEREKRLSNITESSIRPNLLENHERVCSSS